MERLDGKGAQMRKAKQTRYMSEEKEMKRVSTSEESFGACANSVSSQQKYNTIFVRAAEDLGNLIVLYHDTTRVGPKYIPCYRNRGTDQA